MATTRLLLMLLSTAALADGGLVAVNSGVDVARGRSVFVTREELRIDPGPGADCKVEVVTNEPITQRVGRLTPQVFDCGFQSDEVEYVHDGSPLLDRDAVMLRVYRFTASDTLVETALLPVRVLDSAAGAAQLGPVPLAVQEFYGLSNAVDASVLSIKVEPDQVCSVRLMTGDVNAPAFGKLVTEDEDAQRKGRGAAAAAAFCPGNKPCLHRTREVQFQKSSCQHFLNSGLKYQHVSPPSPELDFIPIRVELRDRDTRTLIEASSLWLPVLIRGAVPNQPPAAAFMASLLLEVDQFVLTPLSTAALDAVDAETPQDRLVFNVSRPPPHGYITHLDDHTRPVSSFTWTDLHHMKVAYQPPSVGQSQRSDCQVEFQAIDGSFLAGPPITLHISIRLAETKAPRVSWNMGLDLLEGQSRPITWQQLQIVDSDNIDAVRLVAVDGPHHGRLTVRGRKAFTFRIGDLREGAVVYHHSDSDTTRDHIVFRIGDGRHSVRHKFPINVLPKDDSPPFLVNNVALEVQEGGAVRLQEASLLASDLDSSDDRILFRVVSPPRAGQLVRRTSPLQPGLPVDGFLQRELIRGQIFYRHSGDELFEDSFDFTLSDGQRPPNRSPPHTVVVHVFPVKDQLPVEVPGSRRELTVKETETVLLTRSHLHFADGEDPAADVAYNVTRRCFSPTHPGLMDAGRLFHADGGTSLKKDASTPVLRSFTQHAVNHLKVAFMPPIEDIGPEPLFVQFVFSVGDRQGGAVSDLVFNITVTPVDNQAPEAFTNLLRVEEGGEAFLTEEHVLVRDPDTRDGDLRIRIRKEGARGRLDLRGRTLGPGEHFTLADLRGLRVRFIHDDSESTEDEVGLAVSDGVNTADVTLLIQVLPVNDEPPRLVENLRAELSCEEGGRVRLTARFLSATDRDSDDSRLTYMLGRRPGRGELRRAGAVVDKFSQQDLLQGLVFYVHTGGEIGPEPAVDTVTLIVSDGDAGGTDGCCRGDAPPAPLHGTLPVYDLNVTVLPVNNKAPVVILGDSVLAVDEGSRVPLNAGLLGASDPDSPPDRLTFRLETAPLHGFLENTLPSPGSEKSNAGVPVESFPLEHLTSGFINYVQSEHLGAEPTVDQLSVSVSDGALGSAPAVIHIVIRPTNDEPPSLLLANFTVKEGGARELTPSILDAVDLDAPADVLTFTVVEPPAHGLLVNGIYGAEASRYRGTDGAALLAKLAVATFTLQELRQGMKIVYVHDDSETLEDGAMLTLTDGVHTVQGRSDITVTPVNDQPPQLIKNAGLRLDGGGSRTVSSLALEARDLDSPPDAVFYFLNTATRFGSLMLRAPSGWARLTAGQNFTQDDVDANRLWYRHEPAAAGAAGFKGHDSFRFTLSDLDNRAPPQTFFISIHEAPKGEVELRVTAARVAAGGRVVLNTDALAAWDSSDRPDRLIFTPSVPPRHGLVHDVRHPGVPLASFTQLDVAAQRVCYTHDNSRHDDNDTFSFVVSNGAWSRSGTLVLHVEHADRVPPTLSLNAGLRLTGGSAAAIGADRLLLADPDTPAGELRYNVTRPPRHGRLLLRGRPMTPPLTFTQTDVDEMAVAYRHETPALADAFHFLPTDGTNRGFLEFGQLREEAAVFHIQVEPVDRAAPVLTGRRSPTAVAELDGGRFGIFIGSEHLRASDPDSPEDQLQFLVTRTPAFGYLENTLTGGYIQSRFTQRDLDRRAVVFVLPADVEVTSDSFQFHLGDPAGNTAPTEILDLSWSRIQLSATCYRTCETAGTFQIRVERSGRSADPAYVAIQAEEGSAKPGKDFAHSSAGLIQFDPGVNVKTWNIYPVDDGLEENHEVFTVTLKNPKNAVLGQRTSATVEIIDPRGGRCNPEDLKEGGTSSPPPRLPASGPDKDAKGDPVTDIQVELLWEKPSQPPRGDVPDRRPFPDYEEDFPGQASGPGFRAGERKPGHPQAENIRTFHGLTAMRVEEMPRGGGGGGRPPPERQVGDAPQMDPPMTKRCRAQNRQRKTDTRCPEGWTHFRRRCYIASGSTGSWGSAERTCSLLSGGSLAGVPSRRHVTWLWKFVGGKPFWIGVRAGRSLRRSWTHGCAGRASGSEEAGESSCVLVENPCRWISTGCSGETEQAFVCSSPAGTRRGASNASLARVPTPLVS